MPIYHPDARVTLGIVLESITKNNVPFAFPVRPHAITIFRNGYIEADTFSITFNASHLPLMPDVIRAASAEVYIFNKRGLAQQPESITKGEDSDLYIDGVEVKPSIVGIVDDANMDFDDTGRVVTLIGRDYTGLFLDQDWPSNFRVQYKGPLNDVIQRLADDVPASAGIIKVKVDPPSLMATMPTVGRHEGRANRKGLVFPNKANFWEVMLSIAVRYGFIIFVKGTDIILTTPKAYIAGKTGVVTMAWGKNLHDVHLARKLGRETVPTIECISWDEKRQQVISGRWPNKAEVKRKLVADRVAKKRAAKSRSVVPSKKATKRKPGENATALGTIKNEIQQYVIPGITSKKQLEDIAHQTHSQKGRAEMTAQVSTSDLEDLLGDPVLDISSGDAMGIKFEPFNEDLTAERLEREMLDRGYEPDVAAKFANATDEMNALRQPMRVDNATIDFTTDDGILITASIRQFVNLVVQAEEA